MSSPAVQPSPSGLGLVRDGRRIRLDAGALPQYWIPLLLSLEESLARGALQVLKAAPAGLEAAAQQPLSWTELSAAPDWKRMLLVATEPGDTVALKVFRPGGLLRRCYYQLPGCDTYKKTFAFHRRLDQTPIKSVAALAHGQVLEHGLLQFSFFAMERLADVVSVADYLQMYLMHNEFSDTARTKVRNYAATRLAEMHRYGFFHKDIKPYHCLISTSSAANGEVLQTGPWRWIDLDRCRLHTPLSLQERVTNLYQFWRYILKPLGEDDCTAFIAKYLQHSPELAANVDEISSRVLRHYEKRIARAVERGRLR